METQASAPRCYTCGTTEQLLRCAKCRTAFYCSIAHQHVDWPKHKRQCNILAKQKKNAARMQQMISVTAGSLSNTTTHPPPTTYPLVNDVQMGYYVDNAVTASNVNQNLGAINAPTTTSVIYEGTNDQSISNSQHSAVENMQVDSKMSQLYVDVNTNNATTGDMRKVLSPIVETALQQQQQQQPFQNEFQQPQPEMQQDFLQAPQHHEMQTYAQFRNQNSQYEKSSSYQIGRGDEKVAANFNERRYEELCRNIINDMNQYGLSVVDDFLGVEKGMEVLGEVHNMYCAGVFQDGQLVNNGRTEQDLNRTIRGDKITWVKGVEPGCTSVGYLINQIDAVICRANTMKNNGKLGNYNIKERTKAMVACYPGSGAHYVTHVDNPNKDGRVITAIYYLNVDWDAKRCGGVLRIFPEASHTVADIEPKFDRLIFFWSDKRNPHEVQPSHRTRYAITVWYFDANEREAALNRCKFGVVSKTAPGSSKSSENHLQPGFTKPNENLNPNLNINFSASSSQSKLHQNEICT